MLINEILPIINQGEGILTGQFATLIRFSQCNRNCCWCDSKYHKDGKEMLTEEIINQVKTKNIIISGGESFVQKESLKELTSELKKDGCFITIETNGTIYEKVECDLMSISPKLKSSKNKEPIDIKVLNDLLGNYNCQLKFVISDYDDYQELRELLPKLDPCYLYLVPIILQPNGQQINFYMEFVSDLIEWIKQDQLYLEYDIRVMFQNQKLIYGNKRGV